MNEDEKNLSEKIDFRRDFLWRLQRTGGTFAGLRRLKKVDSKAFYELIDCFNKNYKALPYTGIAPFEPGGILEGMDAVDYITSLKFFCRAMGWSDRLPFLDKMETQALRAESRAESARKYEYTKDSIKDASLRKTAENDFDPSFIRIYRKLYERLAEVGIEDFKSGAVTGGIGILKDMLEVSTAQQWYEKCDYIKQLIDDLASYQSKS